MLDEPSMGLAPIMVERFFRSLRKFIVKEDDPHGGAKRV